MFAYPPKARATRAAATLSSALALATALAAGSARAQSAHVPAYDAPAPAVVSGSVAVQPGVDGVDTYVVGTPTAVIDFTPNDTATGGGSINFEGAGHTAFYQNDPAGTANFTILNRIVPADPSRSITFNGNVTSQLQAAAGGPLARGGTVWFYSPGGIIVGANSTFDVGSLLLSAGDPTGGSGVIGSTTSFTLNSAADKDYPVQVLGTINAPNAGSYVALVAPIVQQAGTVNINGSAAYVAAENTTLTFNSGLFSISTTTGSDRNGDAPLQHAGTTSFTDTASPQRAYLVAVPKNDAITLAIAASGKLGFTTATAANLDQGAVVLSAGYDLGNTATGAALFQGRVNPSVAADIQVNGGTFNADVNGKAGRDAIVAPAVGTSFARDLSIQGIRDAQLTANGAAVTIGRDARVSAEVETIGDSAAATAGAAIISALSGGSLTIGGSATADAEITGVAITAGATGAGTGGTALINASSGNVTIAGNATATARGFSATQGTGGTAGLNASSAQTLAIGGNALADATAGGIADNATIGTTSGGGAAAGTAFAQSAGTLRVTGSLSVLAVALGGAKTLTGTGNGGTAVGGAGSISVGTGATFSAGDSAISANAIGGASVGLGTGGAATGGSATLASGGGTTFTSYSGTATATGGGKTGGAGDGGAATAGNALLSLVAGTVNIGDATIDATATGGSASGTSGLGGAASAGDARVVAQGGGVLTFGTPTQAASLLVASNATGGIGVGNGGAGTASTASISQGTGGGVTVNGFVTMQGNGTGGGAGISGTTGGAGRGGDVRFVSNDGTVRATQSVSMNANGQGGFVAGTGGTGGVGQGGLVNIGADAQLTAVGGTATLNAVGTGGNALASAGIGGIGGAGTGGQALIGGIGTGTLSLAASASLGAPGVGGASFGGGTGGLGTGGTAQLFAQRGLDTVTGAVSIGASGTGGTANGGTATVAGSGRGGQASIAADAGRVQVSSGANLVADGTAGSTTSTTGGTGTGGIASFFTFIGAGGGGGGVTIGGAALASAGGSGTGFITGSAGGSAQGGNANVTANGGALLFNGDVRLDAPAQGGYGPDRTLLTATGGNASIAADGGNVTVLGTVQAETQATGGLSPSNGLTGGNAIAGGSFVRVGAGFTLDLRGDVTLSSLAYGGNGTSTDGGIAATATGGNASASAAGTLTIAGALSADATGNGGAKLAGSTGAGGAATGGFAQASATGAGLLTVTGATTLRANANGGVVELDATAGDGGAATGGTAQVFANTGGTARLNGAGNLFAADAFGGSSGVEAGTGGAGTGGFTSIFVDGSQIAMNSNSVLRANGFGGGGVTAGGAGFGGGGDTTGGGAVNLTAYNGTIDLTVGGSALSLAADGFGGDASAGFGGAGGAGTGGVVAVTGLTRATSAAGQTGRIVLGDVFAEAVGSGADGASGASGGGGGRGGDAQGGIVNIFATAGNGALLVGDVAIEATADGGDGGAGGAANAVGVAGAGGRGGDATGGGSGALGTASGVATSFTLGTASFSNLAFDVSATGGAGGDATAAGVGAGAGGDGMAGSGGLLSRGSPATFGDVFLTGIGTGGAGGFDTAGARAGGGSGYGGDLGVTATIRFQGGARGSITAGDVTTRTDGIGGIGGAPGGAFAGITEITSTDADTRLRSLTARASGLADPRTTAGPNSVTVANGTLAVTDAIDIMGASDIAVSIGDGGVLSATDLILTTLGTVDFAGTLASTTGEIDIANDVRITVGGDFSFTRDIGADDPLGGSILVRAENGMITMSDVHAVGAVTLLAGGDITGGDLESTGNQNNSNVTVQSGGQVALDNVRAGNAIDLESGGSLRAGDVTAFTQPDATVVNGAPGSITIVANGDITLGNASGFDIDIDGTDLSDGPYGNIRTGSITGEFIEVRGGAAVATGNIVTRDLFAGDANTANPFAVEVGALGDLTVGDVSAAGLVALASRTGGVSVGAVTTPASFVTLAARDISVGSASTGRGANDSVFLANVSLLDTSPALASLLADNDPVAFDPAVLTTLAPTRIGGAIRVNGPISTGNFVAGATGGVQLGALDATTRILIDSGAAIATGDITTPATLSLTSGGTIDTGAISAADVALTGGEGVATGDVRSADSVVVTAAGPVTTGAITAGTGTRQGTGRVALNSDGALATGAVNAPGDVAMIARGGGTITVNGAIVSGANIGLFAESGIATQALGGGRGADQFVFLGGLDNAARINADGSFPSGFATGAAALMRGPITVSGAIGGNLVRTSANGVSQYFGPIDGVTSVRLLGGATTLQGAVTAPAIELVSTDLTLGISPDGRAASVGDQATQTVTISALGGTGQVATLGGTAQGPGYTLDAGEFARVRGANIVFGTTNSSAGNDQSRLLIHDLLVNGAGGGEGVTANLTSAQGTLTLASDPGIRVDGNLRLQNATATNGLAIDTANGFELATDAGSIGVFAPGGALGGRLGIVANDIGVGTAALLARAADFEGPGDVSTALALIGAPPATPRPEGFVQAGRIELTGTDYIVIQNSGTADTAAGFTAGSGGMSIFSRASQRDGATTGGLDLVIFGRVANDTGFATNTATRDAIDYSSGTQQQSPIAGFSAISQVNGCLLSAASCLSGVIGDLPQDVAAVTVSTDVQGIIDGALAANSSDASRSAAVPDVRLISLIDSAALTTDALVEEPVTGGGNASLWIGGDGDASDEIGAAPAPAPTGDRARGERRHKPGKGTER